MNLSISLRLALRSLRRATLRSLLTMLGIVIGVAAVVAMVSVGNGARAQVEQLLSGLETNRLSVGASAPRRLWRNGVPPVLRTGEGLSLADFTAIRQEVSGIESIGVQIYVRGVTEAKGAGRRSDARVVGVDTATMWLQGRQLLRGGAFVPSDISRASSVAFVSEFVARNLFSESDAIGRIIQLNDVPFLVVGVLGDRVQSDGSSGISVGDTTVLVPYTSVLRRLDSSVSLTIVLKARDPSQLSEIEQQVRDVLERRRGNRTAEFIVSNVAEAVRSYTDGSRTMSLLLGVVGALALVVGGIGIMNVMLMSVTERTREIGIRMATGARCSDIMRQMLTEAALLAVVGGAFGVVAGIGATIAIAGATGWPVATSATSILLALICSAMIGLLSGYYPAHRAAELRPVQALRSE